MGGMMRAIVDPGAAGRKRKREKEKQEKIVSDRKAKADALEKSNRLTAQAKASKRRKRSKGTRTVFSSALGTPEKGSDLLS